MRSSNVTQRTSSGLAKAFWILWTMNFQWKLKTTAAKKSENSKKIYSSHKMWIEYAATSTVDFLQLFQSNNKECFNSFAGFCVNTPAGSARVPRSAVLTVRYLFRMHNFHKI